MINFIKKYLRFRYLIFFFSFVAGWPCVFYLIGWLPHYTVNYILLFLLATIIVLANNKFKTPAPISLIIGIQCFIWILYSIIHNLDTSYFTRILMLIITYLFLEIQLSKNRYDFVKTYNFWITVQAIAGTIGVLLVLMGLLHPIFEFKEMDMRPGYFFGLFTTNTYAYGLVRNAGFFDEPGALAFWGIYALIINKLFIKNKRIEILLIFGLLSTLSLAYFIQLSLYFWFFYKDHRIKSIIYILTFIIVLKVFASFNEVMDQAIFGRLEFNEETGKLNGDNRSDLMKVCWEIFKTSPIIGQGTTHLIEISKELNVFVGANAFLTLASDGIIGQIIVFSPFFFLLYLAKYDKKYIGAFWILIVGFLQRPYDGTQLLYPLMSFSILMLAYEESHEKCIRNKYSYEKSENMA